MNENKLRRVRKKWLKYMGIADKYPGPLPFAYDLDKNGMPILEFGYIEGYTKLLHVFWSGLDKVLLRWPIKLNRIMEIKK